MEKLIPLVNPEDGTLTKVIRSKSQRGSNRGKKPRKETNERTLITQSARNTTIKQWNKMYTVQPNSQSEQGEEKLIAKSVHPGLSLNKPPQHEDDSIPVGTAINEKQNNEEISTIQYIANPDSTDLTRCSTDEHESSDSDCGLFSSIPGKKKKKKRLFN